VVQCSGLSDVLVVPATIEHDGHVYRVLSVDGFNHDYWIEKVVVEDGVASIGEAFSHCPNLKSVQIGRDVGNIDKSAFIDDGHLDVIEVSESNHILDSREGSRAVIDTRFNILEKGCRSTIIPSSVQSIGDNAFYGQENLDSIVIPEGVRIIGSAAFADCTNLRYVKFPESLEIIGMGAFWNCQNLQSVFLPRHVRSIGENAFSGCDQLKSIVVDSHNPIFDSRQDCNAIIETATDKLVVGCRSTEIVESIREVGDMALMDIPIPFIRIPKSVIRIGERAFAGCTHCTDIVVDRHNPVFDSRNDCHAIVETVSNRLIATCMNSVIDHSVTAIGMYAFCGIQTSRCLEIPEGVRTIGCGAFSSNYSMSRVVIPASIETIDAFAFSRCILLQDIRWDGGVETLPRDVFYGCPSLQIVNIPEGTKKIERHAFSQCINLRYVNLPSTLECIEEKAFEGCPVEKEIHNMPERNEDE